MADFLKFLSRSYREFMTSCAEALVCYKTTGVMGGADNGPYS